VRVIFLPPTRVGVVGGGAADLVSLSLAPLELPEILSCSFSLSDSLSERGPVYKEVDPASSDGGSRSICSSLESAGEGAREGKSGSAQDGPGEGEQYWSIVSAGLGTCREAEGVALGGVTS
jgi:hypothetical protein